MDLFIRAFDASAQEPNTANLVDFKAEWPAETGERVSPLRGTIWRHYKGGIYTVLGRRKNGEVVWFPAAPENAITPPTSTEVVYLCSRTGKTWVRDLSEWHEEVEVGGMKMPRFQHFSGGE